MTQDRSNMAPGDLEALLDAYGADTSRWPKEAQARAGVLLAADAEAGRLVAEAKALDALLGRAPLLGQERQNALAGRIVAQALQGASQAASREAAPQKSGIVIPWPGVARERTAPAWKPSRRPVWSAAALLAASLFIGVFVGTQDLAPGAVNNLMEAVSMDSDFDQTAAAIGSDGLSVALDEEFL
jgi:hypothetical protein